ncbi:MAG: GTP-binding protein [Methanobacteriota archaeon]|nr:MAG: GTP-binding protein [Euryarchaeota archaeon]
MDLRKIPPVHTPEKLLDIAFRRASKEAGKVQARNRLLRRKRAEERRVRESARYITGYLSRLERLGEMINESPPFYRQLVDIVIGMEGITKSLDRVAWARRNIERGQERARQAIRMSKGGPVELRKDFYGKTASILGKIGAELEFLSNARARLRELPTIKEGFTVVIAGMPNVGKSTLLKALTGSKPRIESYPFTTKRILLGYMERGHRRVQVIDTPGLLDRPLSERNPIERQAVLALKELSHLILFIFDPTPACGFTIGSQLRLYREVAGDFGKVIPVVNKTDVAEEKALKELEQEVGRRALRCSAKEGDVGEVAEAIFTYQGKGSIQAPP